MSTLLDPLDEQQTALVELVWSQFSIEARFPLFVWVEYKMRKLGFDAAKVIGGFPSVGRPDVLGRYSAIAATHVGGVYVQNGPVALTMAGLFHLKNKERIAQQIIGAVLEYGRALTRAQDRIDSRPFEVPDVMTDLTPSMSWQNDRLIAATGAVTENEWPIMQVSRTKGDWRGRLALVGSANFATVEDYLTAVTAVCPALPAQTTFLRDTKALAQAIAHLDVTCELVLSAPLIKLPPVNRIVLYGMDVNSLSDLQAAISAVGELLAGLQVPGKSAPHPTGRLLAYLTAKLPKIDAVDVQSAIDVLDAIRDVRNSNVHSRPADKLLAAHDRLGLPFPMTDPGLSWDIIRDRLASALNTLQSAIYAARP